jgi:hypothetical protein
MPGRLLRLWFTLHAAVGPRDHRGLAHVKQLAEG